MDIQQAPSPHSCMTHWQTQTSVVLGRDAQRRSPTYKRGYNRGNKAHAPCCVWFSCRDPATNVPSGGEPAAPCASGPKHPIPAPALPGAIFWGVLPQVASTGDCSSTQTSTSTAREGTSMRGDTGSQGPAPQRGSCHPQEGIQIIENQRMLEATPCSSKSWDFLHI